MTDLTERNSGPFGSREVSETLDVINIMLGSNFLQFHPIVACLFASPLSHFQ